MSAIDDLCRTTLDSQSGGLGFAVVDLDSTLLFGVSHNVPYFTQEYLDAVAGAAVDIFRGRTISTVEALLADKRGVPFQHLTREVQTETTHTRHFMHLLANKPDILLVYITDHTVQPESGWRTVRDAAPAFEAIVP